MLQEVSRASRVAQELKKKLSLIVQFSLRDPRLNKIITISDVLVSSDCKYAKIFITVLNDEDQSVIEEIIKTLKHATGFIRTLLSRKIKLRIIPQLLFVYDNSFVEGIRISNLISNTIKKEKNILHN